MNEYLKLNLKELGLSPLNYVSLPGYSFDCWLMSSVATLDTLQDKQLLIDFVEAKRGGKCGIRGDRLVNNRLNRFADSERNEILRYIDAYNLYGYAMMQRLPYKDFEYITITLDEWETTLQRILNTPDDSDHGYYIVCDINYTNSCKDRTEKLALMPNKRKINENELGYREREKGGARTEKLILEQNNKTECMVQYSMFKFYVKMGAKLTKIHRVIKFKHDYIIRDYIQNKTKKEQQLKLKRKKM